MNLILQSNRWDCLPTSFAMCLDVLPRDIYDFIGHDGSEIIWPSLPEPYCRRSFHIEEMIDFCMALYYAPVCITRVPRYAPLDEFKEYEPWREPDAEARFLKYLQSYDGVILGGTKDGKPHAVAWSAQDQKILDPVGFKYGLDEFSVDGCCVLV